MIGIWQLVLIFAIILVLFGAGRIPKIMKDLGSGLRAFKNGIEGANATIEEVDPEINIKKEMKKKQSKKAKKDNKKKVNEQKNKITKVKKNDKKNVVKKGVSKITKKKNTKGDKKTTKKTKKTK